MKQMNEHKMKEDQMTKEIDALTRKLKKKEDEEELLKEKLKKTEDEKELLKEKLRRSLLPRRSNRRAVCLATHTMIEN